MTHLPSWHSNYIAFLSVVWITQAFSSLKVFVHSTLLAWAITPPGLHPPDFRVHMKLSLLQRVFPLWPHPTTPILPQISQNFLFFCHSSHHNFWFRTMSVLFPLPPELSQGLGIQQTPSKYLLAVLWVWVFAFIIYCYLVAFGSLPFCLLPTLNLILLAEVLAQRKRDLESLKRTPILFSWMAPLPGSPSHWARWDLT